ncbi:ABC transporter ATP-binding protein [Salinicola lusitanus]|uniref:ABC transporter ATP-binding protein n=1 Tax=Salinicola lusitanus TaxID=1949085 RepID=A0ABZ3CW70_9GAMM
MKLVADDVTFWVRGQYLLEGIDLTVHPGEKLGLIGPNGSGKSTLLRLLAGLDKPKRGRVLLNERDISRLSRRDVARALALVEQQATTDARIEVQQAVSLGRTPFLSPLRPWRDEDARIVARALDAVGMGHLAARRWQTLSGGERQRAHLARALAQQPGLLLLDEPTNHLDIHHQLALFQLIEHLPLTVVVALHDLNQALACDRLALLDRGRLVAVGAPHEVLTAARLRQTFGVHADILHLPDEPLPVMRFRQAV